jgi:hypothetical protein
MANKCETCAFWKYFDCAEKDESAYEDDDIGNCTRRPPVFIGVQPNTRPHSPCHWAQPITTGMDVCGDWSATPSNAEISARRCDGLPG